MDEVFTYENGFKNAYTFIIFDTDREKYINYLKNLASEYNNQFLKGIADGLEQLLKFEKKNSTERFSQKQVWIYSRNIKDLFSTVIEDIAEDNSLVGITYQGSGEAVFPHSGLLPAMQAAMRGEINLLLVTDYTMLGINPVQMEDMVNTFTDYGVSVRSYNNSSSSITIRRFQ